MGPVSAIGLTRTHPMPPRTPAMTERLVDIARLAAIAPHGQKEAVYAAACTELGIARATLLRGLGEVAVRSPRKQRSDAGDVTLTRDEALILSALLMESLRKNNKRLLSIGQAVEILRANNEIRAQRIDPATGECAPLSESAIARALRVHALHPDQLLRAAPAMELRSLHPNHVGQIDASMCVLYYLNARTKAESGLQVMDADKFYKNKPANLKSIEQKRVWSYEYTDHNSGAIFAHYVLGAESGVNLTEAFTEAIQQRDGQPFHGVPHILFMDPGSANTSGLFANLARRLQVKTIAHAPGSARATGQVENARNIIERSFESALRLRPVHSLEELNEAALRWAHWYNGTKVHSRHGRTRYEQWMTITAEQLRIAPSRDICRELLTHAPEQRKVSDTLTVSFLGREFDVRAVPRVMVGEKLQITYNPYAPDAAMVVDTDADGHELLHSIPVVARDDAGFRLDGNVIGEDYKRHADTLVDVNRKAIELTAMDATTQAEAEAKRRAKALPFGGRIDPFKPIEQAEVPTYLPRHGNAMVPAVTTARTAMAPRLLNGFDAAAELVRMGVPMTRERNAQVAQWYPEGVPEAELPDLQHRLTMRASLRMVAGGA